MARWARSLGIQHEVVKIPWGVAPFPKLSGSGSLEHLARLARLTAYKTFMRQNNCTYLFVAHHADDQVETAMLKQARGTQTATSAGGMQPVTTLPRGLEEAELGDGTLKVIRPLISVPKAHLLDLCRAEMLPFVVDPSNLDPSYTARNRIRHDILALQQRYGETQTDSAGPAAALRKWESRLSARRDATRHKIQQAAQSVSVVRPGVLEFQPHRHAALPPSLRQALLVHLARAVSPTPPTQARNGISPINLERLDAAVFGIKGQRTSITPGLGVIFAPGPSTRRAAKTIFDKPSGQPSSSKLPARTAADMVWRVSRQPLRPTEQLAHRKPLSAGCWHLWDERFWVKVDWHGEALPEEIRFVVTPTGQDVLPTVVLRRAAA